MVPIVGKPCMEHIIELLRNHGMDEVVVTLAFMPPGDPQLFRRRRSLGVGIEYSVEELPLGTAGSVRLASGKLDETFLVISGDALCDLDLGALVERHKETGADVTIGLKSVDSPLEFGIVVTDDDGKVERFLEETVVGTGLLGHDQHRDLRARAGGAESSPSRGRTTSRRSSSACSKWAARSTGTYWRATGRTSATDQYRQANFDALDESVRLSILDGVRLRGNVWIEDGADIHDVEEIEGPAFIGNNCRITRDASVGPYTVLTNGVTLRERADDAVRDRLRHPRRRGALIEGAIVGRACDIRDHVRIQEGAAIGDEVTIGSEVRTSPRTSASTVQKEVKTRSQVYGLIWETRASSRLFGKDGVSGLVQRRPDPGDGRGRDRARHSAGSAVRVSSR